MKAVNTAQLCKKLVGSNKIPKDFEFFAPIYAVPIDWDSNDTLFTGVNVLTSEVARSTSMTCARRAHRIDVQCPICQDFYPSGRLHQHVKVHKDCGPLTVKERKAASLLEDPS